METNTIAPREIFYDYHLYQTDDHNKKEKIIIDMDNIRIFPYLGKIVYKNEPTKKLGYIKKTGRIKFRDKCVHRIIYEAFYNVKLMQDEKIIHINNDPSDNRITNLLLCLKK